MNLNFKEYVINAFISEFKRWKECSFDESIFDNYAIKETYKKGLVNHYPSMTVFENKDVNIWHNKDIRIFEVLPMSKAAYAIIQDVKANHNGNYYHDKRKNDSDKLYCEHITPNDIVWSNLKKSYQFYYKNQISDQDLEAEIRKNFKWHRLILLTKEEGALLDKYGRTGGKLDLSENEKCKMALYRIHKLYDDDKINTQLYYNSDVPFKKSDICNDIEFLGPIKEYMEDYN